LLADLNLEYEKIAVSTNSLKHFKTESRANPFPVCFKLASFNYCHAFAYNLADINPLLFFYQLHEKRLFRFQISYATCLIECAFDV